jgi:hypothetical protein
MFGVAKEECASSVSGPYASQISIEVSQEDVRRRKDIALQLRLRQESRHPVVVCPGVVWRLGIRNKSRKVVQALAHYYMPAQKCRYNCGRSECR